ncbi:MAG: DMT family transporter [Stomatobaculum sp.]
MQCDCKMTDEGLEKQKEDKGMGKQQREAYGLIIFTFFIWGSVYVAGRAASATMPSYLVACLRSLISVCPLWLMSRKYLPLRIAREDWKYFFLIGFLGYFLCIQSIQLGIQLTGASMASLVNALTPVAITVFAALMLKERITLMKLICLLLALAGTAVITAGASTKGELRGILVVLLGVLGFSAASVLMRRLTVKYPPVLVTTVAMSFSLIFHVSVGIWCAATQSAAIDLRGMLMVLYLGIAGSGIAQVTWTRALSILPASTCSLFYPLQPFFSALLAAVFLRESFRVSFFIGLFLISLDVVLNTLEMKRQVGEA